MSTQKIYNQGRTFPPSAHGAGLIFFLAACVAVFSVKDHYWILSLGYITLWIMFSKTTIDVSEVNKGLIVKKIGLFPIFMKSKIDLHDFDAGIIKQISVKYITTQSTGIIILSSQENKETFMALQLKQKGKYEFETLFKGSRAEIMEFIKSNLSKTKLRFYNAVPKAEYEIRVG